MNLEEKLINGNNQIDKLLDSEVNVKIVCIINDLVLLDKKTKYLPSFIMKKGMLSNNEIIYKIKELLNISINKIKSISFDKYNNYDERYYTIIIDKNNILDINELYIFNPINLMGNIDEKKVVCE